MQSKGRFRARYRQTGQSKVGSELSTGKQGKARQVLSYKGKQSRARQVLSYIGKQDKAGQAPSYSQKGKFRAQTLFTVSEIQANRAEQDGFRATAKQCKFRARTLSMVQMVAPSILPTFSLKITKLIYPTMFRISRNIRSHKTQPSSSKIANFRFLGFSMR